MSDIRFAIHAFTCIDCGWIGLRPAEERTLETYPDGLGSSVSVTLFCPNFKCRSYELEEIFVCAACKSEEAVEGFAHCHAHLTPEEIGERDYCGAEARHDAAREEFRRDVVERVDPLVKRA